MASSSKYSCAIATNIGFSFFCLNRNRLYKDINPDQWPIIYCTTYNIGFLGMEKLHPFDSSKWRSVIRFLRGTFCSSYKKIESAIFLYLDAQMITNEAIVQPNEATNEDLLVVHTRRYLSSLKWSTNVARVLEVVPIAVLPNFLVQRKVLRPLRCQTGGTILVDNNVFEKVASYSFGFRQENWH